MLRWLASSMVCSISPSVYSQVLEGCTKREQQPRGQDDLFFTYLGLFNLCREYCRQFNSIEDKEMLQPIYDNLATLATIISRAAGINLVFTGYEIQKAFNSNQFLSPFKGIIAIETPQKEQRILKNNKNIEQKVRLVIDL